jgi:hypothetical protein
MISFSVGTSLPIGDFGSSNFSNDNAGFAKFGEGLNFSFEHKISTSFSLSAMLYGQRNPLNTKAFESEFSNGLFSYGGTYGGTTDVNPPPTINIPNWKFKKTKWLSAGFLVGGVNEFSLSPKKNNLFIDIKAMIGLAYSMSPNLYGSGASDTASGTQTMNCKSAIGFNYLVGGGLRYNITPTYCLLFDAQYLGTNEFKYKNVTQTFMGEIAPSPTSLTDVSIAWKSSTIANSTQKIASLNFSIGIGMRF